MVWCLSCGQGRPDAVRCSDCGGSLLLAGRYTLLAPLSAGSNSYVARCGEGKRWVLHLWPMVGADATVVAALSERCLHLVHPGIAPFRETFEDVDQGWRGLVQVDGVGWDLGALRRQRPWREEEVLALAGKILDILYYLHTLTPPMGVGVLALAQIIVNEAGQVQWRGLPCEAREDESQSSEPRETRSLAELLLTLLTPRGPGVVGDAAEELPSRDLVLLGLPRAQRVVAWLRQGRGWLERDSARDFESMAGCPGTLAAVWALAAASEGSVPAAQVSAGELTVGPRLSASVGMEAGQRRLAERVLLAVIVVVVLYVLLWL